MGLRAKLATGISILVCFYALIIFFVPTYIVSKDLGEEGTQIQKMLLEKDRRLMHAQEVLLGDVFERIRENINSFLFIIYDMPHLHQRLSFAKEKGQSNDENLLESWESLIRVASYDPDIGFLQLDSVDGKYSAVLKPADAYIHHVKSSPISEHLLAVTLHRTQGDDVDDERYLGIKLSDEVADDYVHDYFVLLPWGLAKPHLERLEKEISYFEEHFKRAIHLGVGQIFIDPENRLSSAEDWSVKNNLIQILVPLVVSNYVDFIDRQWIPSGIVRYKKGNLKTGEALMTEEVLSEESMVDAQKYYSENRPPPGSPTLAKGNLFMTGKRFGHIYIANTLKTETFYLTVGTPIDSLAQQLAIWTNKDVIIRVGDELWVGYGQSGERHERSAITRVLKISHLDQKSGALEIDGRVYLYMNLANLEDGRLGFYELTHIDGRESIAKLTLIVAKHSAWKISFQLFILSLVLIAVIFLVVSRVAFINVIRPITKLAAATQCVVEGRYADVVLPKMGKRTDEVATLTSAFGEMVSGLQEKEKIRGVLDKVVSKEVADEILKSHIHLGGEDRDVSILFGDIRGFTSMTEELSPQMTIELLNGAMTKVTHVIEGEGGVVDKYVGDEIMAIFGAPTTSKEHALHAVSAGVMMMHAIRKWNEERVKEGQVPIEMGIGINSGVAVAGNMGAEDRLNYTVLGSNVNIASRLCSYAKRNQLIITEQTYLAPKVKESFKVEPLPPATLKGISKPVPIYLVHDFDWHA